jgi:hypothetical protein
MSNQGIKKCEDAFQRLKDGEPNNASFAGLIVTPSLFSKEAGFDGGYLKNSRTVHRSLLNKIEDYKTTQQEGGLKRQIAKLEAKLKNSEDKVCEYKQLFEFAISRELLLFEKLNRLEFGK